MRRTWTIVASIVMSLMATSCDRGDNPDCTAIAIVDENGDAKPHPDERCR